MRFEIRFSGDSNLKDSKFYFVQPYLGRCNILKKNLVDVWLENG